MKTDDEMHKEAEQWAFEAFCQAHPHEAYENYPDRFWDFFKGERPGISREEMEKMLKETA